ncbi:membrane protein insertase YidC [Pseudoflavonifractor sp. BIOML-A6]|nr:MULTISPECIES: YidC/Oxa1 family membrane protein insertase [unclassified Pseudoflavonifractor]MTQ97670.1 membrane protein insertase YidC [Pseudoflavonifractor sp. BIOML-A16]MTR07374.1 membrane protein insertase YidC [Pseudoflavonifractor sp. BIOML-A15]MTR33043.1 membrane protein insertase YidC [Pseudoflavonifractor sp. BIOML-A14]MTR74370.1 membrane protein insertase YidC [Pseudoflavonifractor sp. BIOML-A18]MTS65493.1 membrane protein insertase YidC [Pseudoflavonifractor sp. BIOML-A5]MTS7275
MQGLQLVLTPFVWILMLFYNFFHNYGIALILFAVLVKLILFPFSLKGKRSMIQMNMMSGKMQKLQKMYGNNKEKYNLEVQKLYEKEKVNPMSGCLWSFIPLLILLPLYAIIRQPLTYMMNLSPDVINQIAGALNWETVAQNMGWIKEAAAYSNAGYNQLYLASLITNENVAAVQAAVGDAAKSLFAVNFDFLGLNLAATPQLKFWTVAGGFGLFLLPVISAATGFLFSMISMKTNAVNQQSAQAANNSTSKMMLIVSPLMSLYIGFVMPAGLCVYWIAQNLLSMLQEFLASKMLKKDYEKAAEEAARREAEEKEEERRQKEEERAERARRIEEAKQNKGKKKPAAKKKDPEDDRIPASVKEASRVGIRAYARGRNYDPYRYSSDGPTPYEAPGGVQTEKTGLAKEFEKESDELEQVALEKAADDMIVEEILEEQGAAAGEDGDFETPSYDAPEYDTPDYDGDSDDENKD